jgi:Tfp pilus assembly protein FimV
LEVALAMLAGSPSAISAGNVANVPPPASAFIAPPSAPAPAARRIAEKSIKRHLAKAGVSGRSPFASLTRSPLSPG